MRAREFTINVPINIKLGDDDETEVTAPDTTSLVSDVRVVQHQEPESEQDDGDGMGTMVPPLQQQIELQKAALGKRSEVIDDLTDEDEIEQGQDMDDHDEEHFVDLSSFWNQKPVGN